MITKCLEYLESIGMGVELMAILFLIGLFGAYFVLGFAVLLALAGFFSARDWWRERQ